MGKKKDTETPAAAEPVPAEKMTQREAVEKALAAGKELPVDGVPYVLKEFDITLSNQAFSTIKSKINKATGATTPKKRGRPAASTNGTAAHKPATIAASHASTPADLARAVKALVSQYGAEVVKDMATVFAE